MALPGVPEPPSSQIPLPRVCSGWGQGPGAASRTRQEEETELELGSLPQPRGHSPVPEVIIPSAGGVQLQSEGGSWRAPCSPIPRECKQSLSCSSLLRVEDKISPRGCLGCLWLVPVWQQQHPGCVGAVGTPSVAPPGWDLGCPSPWALWHFRWSRARHPRQRPESISRRFPFPTFGKKKGFEAAWPQNIHGKINQLTGKRGSCSWRGKNPSSDAKTQPLLGLSPLLVLPQPKLASPFFPEASRADFPLFLAIRRSRCRTPRAPAA